MQQNTAKSSGRAQKFPPNLARLEYFIAALGSVGIFLGYMNPFFHLAPAVLLLPACLFWQATTSPSARQAFLRGWYTGLWGFSASLYWLNVPMNEVGGLPLLLTIPCILLLGSFLALYTGLASVCFRGTVLFFSRQEKKRQPDTATSSRTAPLPSSAVRRMAIVLFCGLSYGGIELLSAHILTGFPWLSLPLALTSSPLLVQPVNIIGAYGYTALLSTIAIAPFLCKNSSARIPVPAVYALFCIAGILVYGYYSLARLSPATVSEDEAKNHITVGIVQGNIDQNQKWSPEFQAETVNRHLTLSKKALASSVKPVDLLLWPETAMPFYYQRDEPYRSQINAFAKENGVNIIFGTLGYTHDDSLRFRQFNRMQLVSGQGIPTAAYDKQHLVPFGEYNPIPVYIGFLENILQGVNFSAGPNHAPLALHQALPPANGESPPALAWPPDRRSTFLDSPAQRNGADKNGVTSSANKGLPASKSGPLQPDASATAISQGSPPLQAGYSAPLLGGLICYEIIFPALAQRQVEMGASILLTISNDAWFGLTSAPAQHLGHAVLRAVEQGRAVVRSTTSGYSALILPSGEIRHKSILFTEDGFSVTAPLGSQTTIFHSIYHLVDALLLLGLCSSLAFGIFFRKPSTNS